MKRNFTLLLIVVMVLSVVLLGLSSEASTTQINSVQTATAKPVVRKAAAFGVSPAVRDLPQARVDLATGTALARQINKKNTKRVKRAVAGLGAASLPFVDPLLSNRANIMAATPGPALTFEGNSSADNDAAYGTSVMPPDTVGDVGPNHLTKL